MSEMELQDQEVVNLVDKGKRSPRAQVHFVPRAEYERLMAMKKEYPRLKQAEDTLQELRRNAEHRKSLRGVGGAARCCMGLIFLVGAFQGMIHPTFAGAMCLGCLAWGAGFCIRGYAYAEI